MRLWLRHLVISLFHCRLVLIGITTALCCMPGGLKHYLTNILQGSKESAIVVYAVCYYPFKILLCRAYVIECRYL